MRGLVRDDRGAAIRHDLPVPNLAPDETLVRVAMVGVCDTDLHLIRGYMGFQGILGHEFVGYLADGRRVTAEINHPCLVCPTCSRNQTNHCPRRTVLGILRHDGAMADLVRVATRNLHVIPQQIPDEEAVFIEPLAAAYRWTEQVSIEPGDSIAILGDGKLGILCAWVARTQTSGRVLLIGKHPAKLELAGPGLETRLLADAGTDDLIRSFDLVIEATGHPSGLAKALEFVRPLGTVVLKTTMAEPHHLSLAPIVIDEVHLIGSRCGPFPRAIAALSSREIDVRPLIEAILPFNQADQAFQLAAKPGARKVLMRMEEPRSSTG